MPNSGPRERFVYPYLTLMSDSYNIIISIIEKGHFFGTVDGSNADSTISVKAPVSV